MKPLNVLLLSACMQTSRENCISIALFSAKKAMGIVKEQHRETERIESTINLSEKYLQDLCKKNRLTLVSAILDSMKGDAWSTIIEYACEAAAYAGIACMNKTNAAKESAFKSAVEAANTNYVAFNLSGEKQEETYLEILNFSRNLIKEEMVS